MVATPRYSEFNGIYNVDVKFLVEVDKANVLCSKQGLEPPSLAEIDMIVDEIEALNQYLQQSAQVLSYSIGFCDRTACLTFLNLEFLNEVNLKLVQDLLKRSAQDWRIIVYGVIDDETKSH